MRLCFCPDYTQKKNDEPLGKLFISEDGGPDIHSRFISSVSRSDRQLDNRDKQRNHHFS